MANPEQSRLTLSAIPIGSSLEGQNYTKLVNNASNYGPIPPPDVVTLDEAGPSWERPANEGPIVIQRRAAPYDLNDYSGGFGAYLRDANMKPIIAQLGSDAGLENEIEPRLETWLGPIRPSLMLTDVIRQNNIGLNTWIYSYLHQNASNVNPEYYFDHKRNINLLHGIRYLLKIVRDDAEYPSQIVQVINKLTLESSLNENVTNQALILGNYAKELQLYIPKSIILSNQNDSQFSELHRYFFESLYWLRYFRFERSRIEPIIKNLTLFDLYLITANPFERYPARKLLSYYNDEELYLKFGRWNKHFFPKNYQSKQEQLDALVAFSLFPFGYFTVNNWSRPIRVTYHQFDTPLGQIQSQTFDLTELLNEELLTRFNSVMPVIRLAIQVQSSWPVLSDKEPWYPLIQMINNNSKFIHQQYLLLKSNMEVSGESSQLTVPQGFQSLEQFYPICLLCDQLRPPGDFSWCGHGTCISCQIVLGSAKCPFCTEHFVADNINDEFVRLLLNTELGKTSREQLLKRSQQIITLSHNRLFKFDWANSEIKLF